MVSYPKRIVKHLLIKRFFQRYVKNNYVIQKDIEQTAKIRKFKPILDSVEKKFRHLMLYYPEYAFLFFWRIKKSHYWYNKLFTQDYHCKIFGSTKIDGGLVCFHPFATVINAKSIGSNFQFRNGLTIGNKGNDNSLLPVIGNNVTVGVNVAIIGNIVIGNNVTIGAGSVVVKDVPNNVVIAGNPAKILSAQTDE